MTDTMTSLASERAARDTVAREAAIARWANSRPAPYFRNVDDKGN